MQNVMTFTTRSIQSIASPIGSTEFYNAVVKALYRVEGSITHPSRNFTIGVILFPAREPNIEG